MIKAKNIKDRSKLEYDTSIITLIFGIALMFASMIKTNILIEILIWIFFAFYAFKLFEIREKVLSGYYD